MKRQGEKEREWEKERGERERKSDVVVSFSGGIESSSAEREGE